MINQLSALSCAFSCLALKYFLFLAIPSLLILISALTTVNSWRLINKHTDNWIQTQVRLLYQLCHNHWLPSVWLTLWRWPNATWNSFRFFLILGIFDFFRVTNAHGPWTQPHWDQGVLPVKDSTQCNCLPSQTSVGVYYSHGATIRLQNTSRNYLQCWVWIEIASMQPHTAKTPCYNITMILLGKISMEIITLFYSDRLKITTLTDPLKGTDLLKGCLNVQLLSCDKYSVFVIYTKSDRYCL